MAKLILLCVLLGFAVAVDGGGGPDCVRACPLNLDYVCGTDGKTYPNQCALENEACIALKERGARLTRRFRGRCDNPPRALQRKRPSFYRMTPDVQRKLQEKKKQSQTSCLRPCPRNFDFVCGSDGQTYSNPCTMQVQACQQHKSVTVAYKGPCTEGQQPGALMRMLAAVKDVCPMMCPANYAPVCGTNARTYPNECALKFDSCKSKTIVRVEHQGACRVPVASARASVNATEEDCPKMCYMNLDYVCGTDGKTYSNLCQLQTEACKACLAWEPYQSAAFTGGATRGLYTHRTLVLLPLWLLLVLIWNNR